MPSANSQSHPSGAPHNRKGNRPAKALFILSAGRIFITTLILGTSLFIPEHGKGVLLIPSNTHLYILISIVYFYSLICLILAKHIKRLERFIFLQIFADIIFITAFVTISGGVESIFVFLYFFSTIASALFLNRTKLLVIVFFATLFYAISILRVAPIHALLTSSFFTYVWAHRFLLYKLAIHTIALWGIAILTSFLSLELQKRRREIQQQSKAYKQLEQFNENILRSIESGILTVDNSSRISYINQAGSAILEAEAKTLIGQDIFDLFPILGNYLKSSNHLSRSPSHSRIILKDFTDKNKIIGFSSSSFMDSENNTVGKILIFQDLTRYKAMEKKVRESEKLATIGKFAAGLAHEIRNPLASLSGSIQILKASLELSGTDRELMDIVLRETDRLNRLVADFLQFSHTGKEKLTRFNLRALISEILSVLRKEVLENDGAYFQNLLADDFIIFSDRDRLKQVFWNLILNAIQAKDKKPLSVTIRGEKSPQDPSADSADTHCKITVQDTGKGFSKATGRAIFDPFFTTRHSGTGLGLSITQQIISSLGGTIHFDSQEGVGTTVRVVLPC